MNPSSRVALHLARRMSRLELQEEIRRHVQQVLESAGADRHSPERRRERRHAFPFPVQIRQVGECGTNHRPTRVLGRFLSPGGLDFYHSQPLPDRLVIASFQMAGGRDPIQLLLELRWCRFGRHGLYEHGGRFLRSIDQSQTF